jgi:hypothetical protein
LDRIVLLARFAGYQNDLDALKLAIGQRTLSADSDAMLMDPALVDRKASIRTI